MTKAQKGSSVGSHTDQVKLSHSAGRDGCRLVQACWKAASKLNGGAPTGPASLHTPQNVSVFMGLYVHVLGMYMISIATLVMKLPFI